LIEKGKIEGKKRKNQKEQGKKYLSLIYCVKPVLFYKKGVKTHTFLQKGIKTHAFLQKR
jgi:hypothetical protein